MTNRIYNRVKTIVTGATENAGVEIMAPEYRGGKRERSEYGKPKFTEPKLFFHKVSCRPLEIVVYCTM